MTKLTYTNDQQLVNDAAQMLIMTHLDYSGSYKSLPGKRSGLVSLEVYDACSAHLEIAQEELSGKSYREFTESTRAILDDAAKEMSAEIVEKAATLADRKWEAVMTLLGIEQQ